MLSLHILAFAAGILLLQNAASLAAMHWLWLCLPAIFGLLRLRTSPTAVLFSLLLGFLWALTWAHARLDDSLPAAWVDQPVAIIGYVDDLPSTQEEGSSFTFHTEKVLTPQAQVPGRIRLFWPGATPPQAGQRWQLSVKLRPPHGLRNPDSFDSEGMLLQQNIRATGKVDSHRPTRLLDQVAAKPAAMLAAVRAAIDRRIHALLPDSRQAGILAALVIGAQNEIGSDDWQLFRNTGVAHLVSISGLHITLLAGLAGGLCAWLWRRSARLCLRLPARDAALIGALLAAWAYTALAGFAIPAQRTLYMLSTVALLFLLRRSISAVNTLALALLVVCLLDPWAVLAAGFWLSFGAVAMLMWAGQGRIRPYKPWQSAVQAQYAVTLGLIPLSLWLFQQTSLISPLANAFAIPLVSLAVVPLALAGSLLPLDWPLHLAAWLMQSVTSLLAWLDALGLSVINTPKPGLATTLLALLGILWLLLPRGFPARWAGMLALLPLFFPTLPATPVGSFTLTVLDIGQGTATLVQTRHHTLLYDTGPKYGSHSDAGQRVIAPYLRASGVSRLDGMVVSHNDNDHTGGMLAVLQAVPTDWLLTSIPARQNPAPATTATLPCQAGQHWQWDGVQFTVLHPANEYVSDKDNNSSCVVRINSTFGSALLTGDIEAPAEQWLVSHAADAIRSDVLLVPHHGSRTSSTPEFLATVKPSIGLISAGFHNRYGHPKPDIVQRYESLGIHLARTDQAGALILTFDATHPEMATERSAHPRYWQDMP